MSKAQLKQAAKDGSLVRLYRDDLESVGVVGYVLGVGPEFFLLALVGDDIRFNGFEALRVRDVTEVEAPHPYAAFVEKALELKGERKPAAPDIDLASTAALIESAGKAFPIITVSREFADPEVCQVGMPVQVQGGSVSLMEIGPDAVWYDDVEWYPLDEITRLDFGGGYEEALRLVGGRN
jgi:hypothetical protein